MPNRREVNDKILEMINAFNNCCDDLDTQVDSYIASVDIDNSPSGLGTLLTVHAEVVGYDEWVDVVISLAISNEGDALCYMVRPTQVTSNHWAIFSDVALLIKTITDKAEEIINDSNKF